MYFNNVFIYFREAEKHQCERNINELPPDPEIEPIT